MNKIHRKGRKKKVRPINSSKSPEVRYRRQLRVVVSRLISEVNSQIVPLLRILQPDFLGDAYARTLEEAFERMRKSYVNIGVQAEAIANSFVTNSEQVNKRRFYAAMEEAVGVDLQNIIQSEGLNDILIGTTRQNVSLIKSIPEEYFKRIESIVFTGTTQGRKAQSMIKEISNTGKVTFNRAKLIARDQSSKLNSALNQQRQRDLGVEEYIWRTAGDERVRDNHRSKNGKIFRWDDPPKDTGHPGQDIQCRCVAQPIVKI